MITHIIEISFHIKRDKDGATTSGEKGKYKISLEEGYKRYLGTETNRQGLSDCLPFLLETSCLIEYHCNDRDINSHPNRLVALLRHIPIGLQSIEFTTWAETSEVEQLVHIEQGSYGTT